MKSAIWIINLSLILTVSLVSGKVSRVGIIIGANKGLKNEEKLSYADNDANKMFDVLKKYGKFEPDNLMLLKNESYSSFTTSLNKIQNKINSLKAKGDKVIFLFYYSGHGSLSSLHIHGKSLNKSYLMDKLSDFPADMKILLIDACESGSFLRKKGGYVVDKQIINKKEDLASEGTVIITSSSTNESSHESINYKGSIFSHHLINGLKGLADYNEDNQVSLIEAYQYAQLATHMENISEGAPRQNPGFDMDVVGKEGIVLTQLPTKVGGILFKEMPPATIEVYNKLTAEYYSKIYLSGKKNINLVVPIGKYVLTYHTGERTYSSNINLDALSDPKVEISPKNFKENRRNPVIKKGLKRLILNPHGFQISARFQNSFKEKNHSSIQAAYDYQGVFLKNQLGLALSTYNTQGIYFNKEVWLSSLFANSMLTLYKNNFGQALYGLGSKIGLVNQKLWDNRLTQLAKKTPPETNYSLYFSGYMPLTLELHFVSSISIVSGVNLNLDFYQQKNWTVNFNLSPELGLKFNF